MALSQKIPATLVCLDGGKRHLYYGQFLDWALFLSVPFCRLFYSLRDGFCALEQTFVSQIVDSLDISEIVDTYKGGGSSSYNPRMMLKLVLFAYLFRSLRLKETINKIFTQIVLMLVEMGYLSLDVIYVDGTKLESRANRYTFVWRKTIEKNKAKLEAKILMILKQIDEGIAQDNLPDDEPPKPFNSKELKERIAAINRETLSKETTKAVKILEEKHLPKLQEYENHLETLGNRNSYSKTDPSATFMRLKDDHFENGQLKPAYNLQIATENQFITHFDFFSNPADFHTLIPFNNGFKERYNKMPKKEVTDSGYGSEENYESLQDNEIEAFVKYPLFHAEQKKAFKNNPFISQNLFYNKEQDYFVCPMGQHMSNVGTAERKSESGYISTVTFYEAKNCTECPLKCLCHKAKENRRIEVNHKLNEHRKKARELLASEEGLLHRSRRPIEPEAVFGQTKANNHYERFRHFDLALIKMDFAIYGIAFNIGKMWNKDHKAKKIVKKQVKNHSIFLFIIFFTKNSVPNLKITHRNKVATLNAA